MLFAATIIEEGSLLRTADAYMSTQTIHDLKITVCLAISHEALQAKSIGLKARNKTPSATPKAPRSRASNPRAGTNTKTITESPTKTTPRSIEELIAYLRR